AVESRWRRTHPSCDRRACDRRPRDGAIEETEHADVEVGVGRARRGGAGLLRRSDLGLRALSRTGGGGLLRRQPSPFGGLPRALRVAAPPPDAARHPRRQPAGPSRKTGSPAEAVAE